MPALQSTNPLICALLKWAKTLDTSCFHTDNRSWQDMGFLLANEAVIHFLIIIADASGLAFSPPKKPILESQIGSPPLRDPSRLPSDLTKNLPVRGGKPRSGRLWGMLPTSRSATNVQHVFVWRSPLSATRTVT